GASFSDSPKSKYELGGMTSLARHFPINSKLSFAQFLGNLQLATLACALQKNSISFLFIKIL
ncbi:MAG: hypothetical protein Q4A29_02735, partial [Eubacteriales bacterium]|nr:hypothetical protein [Eubacteriales bacterium]